MGRQLFMAGFIVKTPKLLGLVQNTHVVAKKLRRDVIISRNFFGMCHVDPKIPEAYYVFQPHG